ncbi:MAG: MaoC family dehydratase [Paracoccaceae bacterium]
MTTVADLADRVGQEVGLSRWFPLDQPRMTAFAALTQDFSPIHTDIAGAKDLPFGTTVAHGFHTLSLLSAMQFDAMPAIDGVGWSVNYGFDRLRFVAPVFAGAQVRGRFVLKQLDDSTQGEVTLHLAVTIEIEGQDKPAVVADWINRHYLGDPA